MEFTFDINTVVSNDDGIFYVNGGAVITTNAELYNFDYDGLDNYEAIFSASASQYVAIPSFTTGSTGLSFAFWFSSDGNSNWARILDFGNGEAADNIIMGIYEDGLFLSVYSGGVAASQPMQVIADVNDDIKYRVVWTLDPSGVWTVYLDGTVKWQVTGYAYPAAILRTSNFLGKSNWQSDPYFTGGLDEFRVYNRVLTSLDANLLYDTDDLQFSTAYGAAVCALCPAGTYYSLGFCMACSPGSYQSSEGQFSCVSCSKGKQ